MIKKLLPSSNFGDIYKVISVYPKHYYCDTCKKKINKHIYTTNKGLCKSCLEQIN